MPRSWPYISQSLKLKKKITIRADFSLWKIKIRALLAHQSLEEALEEEDSNRLLVLYHITKEDKSLIRFIAEQNLHKILARN